MHDSSAMLNDWFKKRPDIYFKLKNHCVIVEIDENQHKSYKEICECVRLNEIITGITKGELPLSFVFIRYNPDKTKFNGEQVNFDQTDKLNMLIKLIKQELCKDYNPNHPIVLLYQLYFDQTGSYDFNPLDCLDITKTVMDPSL